MDRRGHEDHIHRGDVGANYNQDSPNHHVKQLPLAPIVSTNQDRRGLLYAPVSTRRGSSIFSPTQTLDHHRRPPPPLDPDPPTPTTDDGASNSKNPPPQPPPPPPPPTSIPTLRYRECLKNHAASMGGHVVDGCGEFMPSGEDGTAEALRCAACDCHRNFHRKEVEGGGGDASQQPNNYNINRAQIIGQYSQNPPSMATHQQHKAFAGGLPPPAMVNFGGGDESSSEDLNAFQSTSGGGGGGGHAASSKKRFRTKFSQHQKEKMQEVAEKIGWRIQKQDEDEVQRLCSETGVKRQVFKVWMHNNKQAMKKRHHISD